MDYLRTLGSAAVSSLVQKSGLTLPFSLGQKVASFEGKSIWTLYEATKRVRVRLIPNLVMILGTETPLGNRKMAALFPYSNSTQVCQEIEMLCHSREILFESCAQFDILMFSNTWTPSRPKPIFVS